MERFSTLRVKEPPTVLGNHEREVPGEEAIDYSAYVEESLDRNNRNDGGQCHTNMRGKHSASSAIVDLYEREEYKAVAEEGPEYRTEGNEGVEEGKLEEVVGGGPEVVQH